MARGCTASSRADLPIAPPPRRFKRRLQAQGFQAALVAPQSGNLKSPH